MKNLTEQGKTHLIQDICSGLCIIALVVIAHFTGKNLLGVSEVLNQFGIDILTFNNSESLPSTSSVVIAILFLVLIGYSAVVAGFSYSRKQHYLYLKGVRAARSIKGGT